MFLLSRTIGKGVINRLGFNYYMHRVAFYNNRIGDNFGVGGRSMFDDFMTPETLTTFIGLVAATSLIVQFTKPLLKRRLPDVFIRVYVFLVALILTFIFGEAKFNLQSIVLNIINAMIITTSAMGGYEALSDPLSKK